MIGRTRVDDRPAQHYAGIRKQASAETIGKTIGNTFDELSAWLQDKGIQPTGAAFVRYHVIDMPGYLEIEMGVPVASPFTGDDTVQSGVLPAGRYASVPYRGVRNAYEANATLVGWGEQNNIAWDRWDDPKGDAFRSRYEVTFTNPDDEPDMDKWESEVAIKLADS